MALVTWQTLNGLPPTGVPDEAVLGALGGDTNVLTRYTVTTNDLANVAPVPVEWEERAKLTSLKYETVQEMLAERGHTSQRALERLNPGVAWPNPPAGTEVVLPDCTSPKPPRAGSIRIALGRMEVTVFSEEGRLVALFPCSIAREKRKRPDGELAVKTLAPNPNYTYDPQLFEPGGPKKTKLVIPSGPNNPVGLAWIGLSLQGYGMHGTPLPEHIGRAAVNLQEMRVHERVAPRQADLAAHVALAAEVPEVCDDLHGPGQRRLRPGAAVVAVAAGQVAGLGQVPLQGEDLGPLRLLRG